MELDLNTDYGKLVAREFFSGKYDAMTVKEFRELMHRINTGASTRPDKCSAEVHALKRMGGYSICPDCDKNISGG